MNIPLQYREYSTNFWKFAACNAVSIISPRISPIVMGYYYISEFNNYILNQQSPRIFEIKLGSKITPISMEDSGGSVFYRDFILGLTSIALSVATMCIKPDDYVAKTKTSWLSLEDAILFYTNTITELSHIIFPSYENYKFYDTKTGLEISSTWLAKAQIIREIKPVATEYSNEEISLQPTLSSKEIAWDGSGNEHHE